MKNKIGLVGSPYHIDKVDNALHEEGFDTVVLKKELGLFTFIKEVLSCDRIFVVFINSNLRFILQYFIPFFVLRKKIYLEWIGSDVLFLQRTKLMKFKVALLNKIAVNTCECEWIQKELVDLGISAQVGPYITYSTLFKDIELTSERERSDTLKIVTYGHVGRESLYNIDKIYSEVKGRKGVKLVVVGHDGTGFSEVENIDFLGWVKPEVVETVYKESDVFLRVTEHDGLSYSVLEAMHAGLQVVFSYPYPHTYQANDSSSLSEALDRLIDKKNNDKDMINYQGHEYIVDNFVKNRVSENNIKNLLCG